MIHESARGPTTAPPPPPPLPAAGAPEVIRRVRTLDEYHECVALQEETWGEGFSERVPSSVLMVTQKLGGVVAAAFHGERMVGFVFGMTGPMHGRLVHWSDMLAVRPEARGSGIGERLKRHQRELVRALGVDTMHWTFDPLVARNARLNLVRLGARATEYVPNMYGEGTGSPLHGGMPTDRLVVTWDLTRDDTRDDATPRDASDGDVVRIAVPHDVHALPPDERAEWRAVTRAAFVEHLARGYRIVAFRRGADDALPYYELARDVFTEHHA